MLPDVDEQGYDDWHNQLFSEEADRKIHSLDLTQTANDRLADLNRIGSWAATEYQQSAQPTPAQLAAPPSEPAAPEPAPASEVPPPEAPPSPEPSLAAPPAPPGPVAPAATPVAPAVPPSPPVSAPAGDDNWLQSAFGAAVSAGADVGKFVSGLGEGSGDRTMDAMNAVLQAGGDVDQFLQNLRPTTSAPTRSLASGGPAPGGQIDASNHASFVQSMQPYAEKWAGITGIPASYLTAWAASESNWGKAGNALFGIKQGSQPGTAPGLTSATWEQGQGATTDTFANYNSPDEAFASLDQFLQGRRYQPIYQQLRSGQISPDQFMQGINAAGYATDPVWGKKIGQIADQSITPLMQLTGTRTGTTAAEQALSQTGGWAQQAAGGRDVSQFGDSQLTNDEAYAACGPAAAVRFAQRFGRNPTLREATDLAKTVGWTSSQGMAGLGSEKALMDKLGVPTKLVSGADWGTFANEARTGNPVTISTTGHYFTADGWDPQTNRFHVGRSGLDLKGGSEWMTPEQMTAIMGPVQGGLLADNPQVASPSLADQDSNPLGWLGRAKDAMVDSLLPPKPSTELPGAAVLPGQSSVFSDTSNVFGPTTQQAAQVGTPQPLEPPKSPLEEMGSNIANAITSGLKNLGIGGSTDTSQTAGMQPIPSDVLTNPLGTGNALGAPSARLTGQPAGGIGPPQSTIFQDPTRIPGILRGPELTTDQELLDQAGPQDIENARRLYQVSTRGKEPTAADIASVLRSTKLGEAYAGTHEPGSTRMYHGTTADFATARADLPAVEGENTLGPGYYVTPNPDYASSYARDWRGHYDEPSQVGANVRAIDMPSNVKLFDLQTVDDVAPDELERLSQVLRTRDPERAATLQYVKQTITDAGGEATDLASPDALWRFLTTGRAALSVTEANRLIERAGYDGIRGGDEGTVIFGSSLNKLRNAISGQQGGEANAGFAAGLGGAAAVGAGAYALRDQIGGGIRDALTGAGRVMQQGQDINVASDVAAGDVVAPMLKGPALMTDEELLQQASPEAIDTARQLARLSTRGVEPTDAQVAEALRGTRLGEAYAGTHTPGGKPGKLDPEAIRRAYEVPANQGTKTMLEAPLPQVENTSSRLNKFVRATTNRFEAADRYMEDALRDANLTPDTPGKTPEGLDLSAKIRNMSTDGSVKIAEDTYLKPAVAALGGDEAAGKLLSSYLIHRNNIDIAAATGQTYRTFPGGGSLMESQNALRQMQTELGPEAWKTLQGSGSQVYDLVGQLRKRMLDSGLIDQHDFNMWNGQYPNWVPTRILDYLDEAGGPRVGSKISLSDNGVRSYSDVGTEKFREDPLASVLGLVQQVEKNARKNEAVRAVLDLDKLGPDPPRILPTDAPVKTGESVIQYIRNGVVERHVAPPDVAEVINGAQIEQAPGFTRDWVNFQRGVTTVLSPAFALIRNPTLDVPLYLQRQMAREGGDPRQLKRVVSALFSGYADAFQGLPQGEFRGPGMQQYMAGGGSGSTIVSTAEKRAEEIAKIAGGEKIDITSGNDIARIVRRIFDPVQAIAERSEAGPRIAAMRLAEARGATPQRAILEGRTTTLDFNEGGTLSKTLNSFIPFFNVGPQDVAQVARMFKENPKGATASMAMLVGLPTILAEAWNRSDAQRSKDYDDVPQSVKRQGPVIMLPGEAPVDKDGNRHPQYWGMNFGSRGVFSNIAREAASNVLSAAGNENAKPEDWQHLLQDILWTAAPTKAGSLGDVPRQLLPEIAPGVNTATQLGLNRDFFRGTQIATERTNKEASQAGREIAGGLTSVARTIDPKYEIQPAQVDFAVKDMLGGIGEMGLGARALLPGAEPQQGNEPQKVPVLGGALRAAGEGGLIGETSRQARENVLTPSAQTFLQSQGVEYVPSPVDSNIEGIPLRRDEETQYQQMANRYLDDEIHRLEQSGTLQSMPKQDRLDYVQEVATETRQQARADIVDRIGQAEIDRRRRLLEAQGVR